MIVDRDSQVHTEIFQRLQDPILSVPVTTEPTVHHNQYVRIDAFTALDNELYKTSETSTHSFTIHAFDAPDGGSKSLTWVRETMAVVDQLIRGAKIAGGLARRQEVQFLFEPTTAEGVFDAHGFIRYSVQIGA